MLTLLDRYILKQLMDYFLMAIILFSLVAFFSDALLNFIQDVQKYGLTMQTVMLMIGLQLPKTISLVLPASCFLAVMLVFSQLNQSFQIIAMRMNGISLNRLILPVILVATVASGISYYLGDFVVPYCNQLTRKMLLQAVQQATLPRSSKSFLFNDYDKQHQLRKLIYIRQFKGKDLKDCTILDFSEAGTRKIIQAKSGTWSPEVWEFNNANAYILKDRGEGLVSNHSGTIRMTQLLKRDTGSAALKELDSPDDDQNKLSIHSETMTFATLFHRIGLREQAGLRVSRGTYMNLWDKLTLPLSCLVITLIAVPLAITHPRSSNRRGFVFSLAVLFSAYLLRSVFESLGQAKWFTLPGISKGWMLCGLSWLPLVILMILAMILLRKKSGVLA